MSRRPDAQLDQKLREQPDAQPGETPPSAGEAHAATYRRRQIRGLLIIGALLVASALVRANWHEVFPVGWWHVW